MNKLTILAATFAIVLGNVAQAQNSSQPKPPVAKTAANTTGNGAKAGTQGVVDPFAWGLGIGAFATFATVVGLTVAAAAGDTSSGSHADSAHSGAAH